MDNGAGLPASEQLPDDWFVAELVAMHQRLLGYMLSLVPGRADAEDLVQKTLLIVWQDRHKFDPERDFFAWVCGITRNQVLHHYRALKRSKTVLSSEIVEQLVDRLETNEPYFAERQRALAGCLEKLPLKQRELIEAFYKSQQSVKDFAARRATGLESLYKSLQRIRASLLECINATLRHEGIQ
jgi:RNA polymerase sigma-70 factor (ECF subfamily)